LYSFVYHRHIYIQAAVDSKAKVNDISSTTSSIYTFRSSTNYAEDPLFRHIEPTHAYSIDLTRLSNFAIKLASTSQAMGGNVHLYAGRPKTSAAKAEGLKVIHDILSYDIAELRVFLIMHIIMHIHGTCCT
jgi:Acetyl-CoA carboxylase, central region